MIRRFWVQTPLGTILNKIYFVLCNFRSGKYSDRNASDFLIAKNANVRNLRVQPEIGWIQYNHMGSLLAVAKGGMDFGSFPSWALLGSSICILETLSNAVNKDRVKYKTYKTYNVQYSITALEQSWTLGPTWEMREIRIFVTKHWAIEPE